MVGRQRKPDPQVRGGSARQLHLENCLAFPNHRAYVYSFAHQFPPNYITNSSSTYA